MYQSFTSNIQKSNDLIISFADKTKIFKNIFFLTSLKTDLINLKNY